MIYGSARDKNMHKLIKFIDKYPVFPLFARGESLMQPVYVDDLANGIISAISMDSKTAGKEYNLAGPAGIKYRNIVECVISELGKNVKLINIDANLAYWTVKCLEWIPGFPINDEQVLRLKEDKVFDISNAADDLGYKPRHFEDGIRQEIQEMRKAGLISTGTRG
jgi:nucleoside-diphosphate-sugar epimerase